jgi:hypothetical protein
VSAINWQALRDEYRTGRVSNVALAEKYGVSEGAIRKKAKKESWPKDLTTAVQEATRSKLVRESVRVRAADAPPRTEAQIVEDAADENASMVRSHRRDIKFGADLCSLLVGQLRDTAVHRGTIEQLIEAETAGDKSTQRRTAMYKAVSLGRNASTMRDLSTAMKNLIAMERQAFNIGAESGGGTLEDWLDKLEQ